MSKGKKRAFQEWESCAPGLQDGRFMRLANSQLLHEKMRGLGGKRVERPALRAWQIRCGQKKFFWEFS